MTKDEKRVAKILIDKLDSFLGKQPFTEECQVLYLMAEIRNILDLGREDKKTGLKIFCDWTLHNNLNFKIPQDFFINKFEKDISESNSAKINADNIIKNNTDFLTLRELKTELNIFLNKNQLSTKLTDDASYWGKFRRLLLEVLKGRPVQFDKGQMETLRFDSDKAGFTCYRLKLRNNNNIIKIKLK